MSNVKKVIKRCGDCYWITSTGDGHFICEDGDLKIRVRKKDSFDCDNFRKTEDILKWIGK